MNAGSSKLTDIEQKWRSLNSINIPTYKQTVNYFNYKTKEHKGAKFILTICNIPDFHTKLAYESCKFIKYIINNKNHIYDDDNFTDIELFKYYNSIVKQYMIDDKKLMNIEQHIIYAELSLNTPIKKFNLTILELSILRKLVNRSEFLCEALEQQFIINRNISAIIRSYEIDINLAEAISFGRLVFRWYFQSFRPSVEVFDNYRYKYINESFSKLTELDRIYIMKSIIHWFKLSRKSCFRLYHMAWHRGWTDVIKELDKIIMPTNSEYTVVATSSCFVD
jgi:hypothetical protein